MNYYKQDVPFSFEINALHLRLRSSMIVRCQRIPEGCVAVPKLGWWFHAYWWACAVVSLLLGGEPTPTDASVKAMLDRSVYVKYVREQRV